MAKKILKYRKIKLILIILFIIITSYFIIFHSIDKKIINLNENNFKFSQILNKSICNFGSNPEIYISNKSFFIINGDGVSLYDMSGNVKWNYVFNMTSEPIVINNKNYLGVVEHKGKSLYIFDISGICYEKQFDYPILSFSINSIGYSSVILENGENYTIYVQDFKGCILMRNEIQDKNIFPVSTSISNDGKILAVSFLDINNSIINSKILFYYTNGVEVEECSDSIFGSILDLEDQIMGKIKFMENNILIGISNKEIVAIETGMKNYMNKKWSVKFNSEMKYACFIDDTIGLVFEDSKNEEDNLNNKVQFYNLNGKIIGEYKIDEKVRYVNSNFNSIVLKAGSLNRKIYAINCKGKFLWKHNMIYDIKYINFIDNTNKILILTPIELKILERVKSKYNLKDELECDDEEIKIDIKDTCNGIEEEKVEDEDTDEVGNEDEYIVEVID